MKKTAALLLRLPPLRAERRLSWRALCFSTPRIASAAPFFSLDRRPGSSPTSLPRAHLPLRALFSTARARGGETGPLTADEPEPEPEEWEEEEEAEPEMGDGGDGGGIVLGGVAWGERALSAAREVLLQFGDDVVMYAFKVSPKGYIYVRLDKLTNEYGCPSIEEIEEFNTLYKKRLDEIGEHGEIPDLAIEVSSPGAERLLKVPEDLDRFKQMPMWVHYVEEDESTKHRQYKEGVFWLELNDNETGQCVWKLADVKENRAELGKGRPLSRKHRDWRLRLPFDAVKKVTLYLGSNN